MKYKNNSTIVVDTFVLFSVRTKHNVELWKRQKLGFYSQFLIQQLVIPGKVINLLSLPFFPQTRSLDSQVCCLEYSIHKFCLPMLIPTTANNDLLLNSFEKSLLYPFIYYIYSKFSKIIFQQNYFLSQKEKSHQVARCFYLYQSKSF